MVLTIYTVFLELALFQSMHLSFNLQKNQAIKYYYYSLSISYIFLQSGVNLRGVPYDWRIPPTAQGGLYSEVQALIEQTYTANGNKKVQLGNIIFSQPW